MYESPGMRPMSTSSLGWASRSFISGSRLWPPARIFASGSSSSPTASCRLVGAAYANLAGNIGPLLVDARGGGLAHGDVRLLERFLTPQLATCRQRGLDDVLITG